MRSLALLLCIHCGQPHSGDDRFFDSDGVRIRYRVFGQGAPVILIHGFGESLERWESAGVVRVLAPHFQVITVDVRGHGRSGKPHDRAAYGVELAGDVVRLMRHLGLATAHVVGYSLGALVALDIAVLHPEHARSVVLGGAGWTPPEALAEFAQQAEAFEQGQIPPRDGDDPRALAALLRGLRVWREEDVRRISVPMAALIGANDRFLPNVRRLSRALTSVHVETIPDADHATALDHPRFATQLLERIRAIPSK